MDTDKLKALMSAIDTGSISAAAEELKFTPSGISRSIASLEEMTGFPLLVRGKGGVRPTAECEDMMPIIRSMLRIEEQYIDTASRIRGIERGTIRVGNAYPSFNLALAEAIVDFRRLHPGIMISLEEGTSSALSADLIIGELDICLISRRENVPEFLTLKTDALCMWVPEGHPSASRGIYHLKDMETEDVIEICAQSETDNSIFLKKYHVHPRICASTSDMYSAFAMVEAGMGIALINGILAGQWKGNVRCVPLDKKCEVEIGIATGKKDETSPAAAEFIRYLIEEKQDMLT